MIASRVIEVPRDIDIPPTQYQDTTVTSSVRDSSGQIVTPNISRADGRDVPPGGIATLLLPRGRMDWSASNIRKSAFRLQSTQPVVAYQFSPYCCNFSFSNDASLLFPTSSLGTDYRYVGAAHHQFFDIRSGSTPNEPAVMTIVGASDDTSITVNLPPNQNAVADPTGRISGYSQVQFTLDAQKCFNSSVFNIASATILPAQRLLGTSRFRSLVVMSAHLRPQRFLPVTICKSESIPQPPALIKLVPVAERGSNFPAEVVYWKILANEDDTVVQFSVPFSQLFSVGASNSTIPHCGNLVGERQHSAQRRRIL